MTSKEFYLHGVLPIALSSTVWAFGYFLRKMILPEIHPLLLTFLTFVIVALLFGMFFANQWHKVWRIFLQYPWSYVSLSFCGVAGTVLMYMGLVRLDLSVTVLLEKLQPIFIVLLASWFLHEKLSKKQTLFVGLALASSYFLVVPDPTASSFGRIDLVSGGYVILAAFLWAFANIIGKHLLNQQGKSQEIVLIRFVLGSLMLLPLFIFRNTLGLTMHLTPFVLGILMGAAIFSTALGYFLFYSGLRHTSASTAGFLELITPLVGVGLGVVFLGEELRTPQILAAVILLFSIHKITQLRHVA